MVDDRIMSSQHNMGMAPMASPGPEGCSPKKMSFFSKLFNRTKSERDILRVAAEASAVPWHNARNQPPSHGHVSGTAYTNGQESDQSQSAVQHVKSHTSERWQAFADPRLPTPDGRHTRQSMRREEYALPGNADVTPKRPKAKRSTSALASIFRTGRTSSSAHFDTVRNGSEQDFERRPSISYPISPSAHAKEASSKTFSKASAAPDGRSPSTARKRASTVAVPGSSHVPHLASAAQLFDASQADMSLYQVDSGEDGYPIRYTPVYSPRVQAPPSFRAGDTSASEASQTVSQSSSSSFFRTNGFKSRSTTDLTLLTSPATTSSPSAFASPNMKSDTSSHSRSDTPFRDLASPASPHVQSRSPSALALRSPSSPVHGLFPTSRNPSLSIERTRSQSPTPNAYITSTLGRRTPPPNYLDHILDSPDIARTGLGIAIPGASEFGQLSNHNGGSPSNASEAQGGTGLSVKVAKELRPTTAGTFGRPRTANRPGTAVSRPDTGLSNVSDRPDTGLSAFGGGSMLSEFLSGLPAVPSLGRFQGRMRRRSNATESESEEEVDITVDSALAQAATVSLESADPNQEHQRGRKNEDRAKSDSAPDHSSGLHTMEGLSVSFIGRSPKSPPPERQEGDVQTNCSRILRPTTADTTHLPLDLPDIDIAFNPRGSLGSLGRQSSVSDLSEFGDRLEAGTTASAIVSSPRDAQPAPGRDNVSTPLPSNIQDAMPAGAADTDETPRKGNSADMSLRNSRLPVPAEISTTERASPDRKLLGRLLTGRSGNRSLFGDRQQGLSAPPTPAIVTTFDESTTNLATTNRLSLPALSFDIETDMTTLSSLSASSISQLADIKGRNSTSTTPEPSLLSSRPMSGLVSSESDGLNPRGGQAELVANLSRLLEDAMRNAERLQQSLDSLRESTGADMRRATQQINELKDENRLLKESMKKLMEQA